MTDISVVIPLFNKKKFIKRALLSVLNQTYSNFEVLIIDDGSTDDGVFEIRDIIDNRIEIIHQENKGVSSARNLGIKHSKSPIVAFLDADDEWSPDHLSTIVRLSTLFPYAGAYTTSYLIKTKSGYSEPNFHLIHSDPWEGPIENYFLCSTISNPLICSSTAAVRKEVFSTVGNFNEAYGWGEDSDMWARIALKFDIVFSWKGFVIYYNDIDNSLSKMPNPIFTNPTIDTLNHELNNTHLDANKREFIEEYIALKRLETATHNIISGRRDLALFHIMNCKTKILIKKKILLILLIYLPLWMINYLKRLDNIFDLTT